MKRLLAIGILLVLVASIGFAVQCGSCYVTGWYYYCSTSACATGPYFAEKCCDVYKKYCWNPPDEYAGWMVYCYTNNCQKDGVCCDYPD